MDSDGEERLGGDPWSQPPPDASPRRAPWTGVATLAFGPPGPDERPAPTLISMLGAGAGLLVAAGLFFLLGELDGYDQRTVGLVLSLLFVALGVAISTINRSSRAASAGVALSLLAVIPLTVYLFANADVFGEVSGRAPAGSVWDGIRGVVTLMLATAAVLWLLGFLFSPARRYGAYLGAALLAVWAIPLFNIQVAAIDDARSAFGSTSFEPVPFDPGIDSGFADPSFDDPSLDDPSLDDPSVYTYSEPDVSDASTKLGVTSLAFGAAYLLLAAWRDRRGDARIATAALAPAIVILLYAVAVLSGHVGWVGHGLLAVGVGATILAVGLRAHRRASSWIGLALATFGLGSLVAAWLGDSPRAVGGVLTVLGTVIALGAGLAGRGSGTAGTEAEAALVPPVPTADPAWPWGPPPPSPPTGPPPPG